MFTSMFTGPRRRTLRRSTGLLVVTPLLAALAGCGSTSVTDDDAHDALNSGLKELHGALTGNQDLAQDWSTSSARVDDPACGDKKARWRAVASYATTSASKDGDAPTTQAIGQLHAAGWRPSTTVGDLDDDPAVLVPAEAGGKNTAGVSAEVVITRTADGFRYTITLRTACSEKS